MTRGITSNNHVAVALKRGAFSHEDVQAHRVVAINGGVGKPTCDWSTHLPDMDDSGRESLIELEGASLDKNGRILGRSSDFQDVEMV